MKFVDSFFAWSLLAYGFVTIIVIEMRHPAHAVLDTPIFVGIRCHVQPATY